MNVCRIKKTAINTLKDDLRNVSTVQKAKEIIRKQAARFNKDGDLEILSQEEIVTTIDFVIGELSGGEVSPSDSSVIDILNEVKNDASFINNANNRRDMAVLDLNAKTGSKGNKFIPCFSKQISASVQNKVRIKLSTFNVYDPIKGIYTCNRDVKYNILVLKNQYYNLLVGFLNLKGYKFSTRLYKTGSVNAQYYEVMQAAFEEIKKLTNNFKSTIDSPNNRQAVDFITAFYVLNNFDRCVQTLSSNITIKNKALNGCLFISDDKYDIVRQRMAQQNYDEAANNVHENENQLYLTFMQGIEVAPGEYITNVELDYIREQVNKAIDTHKNQVIGVNTFLTTSGFEGLDENLTVSDVISTSPENMRRFTDEQRTLAILSCLDTSIPAMRAIRDFWIGVIGATRELEGQNMTSSQKSLFSYNYNLQLLLFNDIVTHKKNYQVTNEDGVSRVKGAADSTSGKNEFRTSVITAWEQNLDDSYYAPGFRFSNGKLISELGTLNDIIKAEIETGWGINLAEYDHVAQVPGLLDFLRESSKYARRAKQDPNYSFTKAFKDFADAKPRVYAKMMDTFRSNDKLFKTNETDFNGNSISTMTNPSASRNFVQYREEFRREGACPHNIFVNEEFERDFQNAGLEGSEEFSGIICTRTQSKADRNIVENKDMTTQELMSLSINSEFLGSLIGSDKCYIQPVCASDKSIPPLVTSYAFNNKNLSKSLVYQSIDKLREINFQQFSEYHQDQARFFAKNWIDVLKKIYPDHNFLSTDDTEIMACIQDIIQLLETTSAKEINRHLAECQSERQDFTIASGLHYDMVSGDRFVMNMTVLRNFVMAFDRNKFEYYTEIAIHDSIEDCSEIEIKLADEVSDQDTKKIALLLNYNIDRDFTKKLAIKIVFSGRVEPTNDEIGAYFAKNKNIAIPNGIDTNTFIKQLLMKEAAEVRKDFLTKYHIYTALVKEGYLQIMQKDYVFHKSKIFAKPKDVSSSQEFVNLQDNDYFQQSNHLYQKEENARYIVSTKRNNFSTATYLPNIPAVAVNGRSEYRVAPTYRAAIYIDRSVPFVGYNGDSAAIDPWDGGAHTCGIHSILENNSCVGKDVYGSKKYISGQTTRLGEALYKYADFPLDNAFLRKHDGRGQVKMRDRLLSMYYPCKIPANVFSLQNINRINQIIDEKFYTIVDDPQVQSGKSIGRFAGFRLNEFGNLEALFTVNHEGTADMQQIAIEIEKDGDGYRLSELWEKLGGEWTYDDAGMQHGNEGSNRYLAYMLCEIYPQGREEYIAKTLPLGGVKQYWINLNNRVDYVNLDGEAVSEPEDTFLAHVREHDAWNAPFRNPDGSHNEASTMTYMISDSSKTGMQNDNTHEIEDADVASTTQYFAALSHGGFNLDKVGEVYECLAQITLLHDKVKGYDLDDHDSVLELLKDMKISIESGKNISSAAAVIDDAIRFMQKNRNATLKDLSLPFSDKGFFQVFSRALIKKCNSAIRARFAGMAAIMNPSNGIISIYEDAQGNTYEKSDILRLALANPPENGWIGMSENEIITYYLNTDERFKPTLVNEVQSLDIEDHVTIKASSREQRDRIAQAIASSKYYAFVEKKYFNLSGENAIDIEIKDPFTLFILEEINSTFDEEFQTSDEIGLFKVTGQHSRDLKTSNMKWTEDGELKSLWFTSESKNLVVALAENKRAKKEKLPPVHSDQEIEKLKFKLKRLQFELSKGTHAGKKISNFVYTPGEQAITKYNEKKHHIGDRTMRQLLDDGYTRFEEYYGKSVKVHDKLFDAVTSNDTPGNKYNATLIIRPDEDEDIFVTDFEDIQQLAQDSGYEIISDIQEPYEAADGSLYFTDENGQILLNKVKANNRLIRVKDQSDRIINIVCLSSFTQDERKEFKSVIKSARGAVFISTETDDKKDLYSLATRENGKNAMLKPWLTKVPRVDNPKHDEKITELTSEYKRTVKLVAKQIFASIQVANDCLSIRTPSQTWQSGLVLKTVAFVEGNLNDVYTNLWEEVFQGSDYDIDKANTVMYHVNDHGVIDMHSAIARTNTVQNINDSLEYLPIPDEKHTVRDDSDKKDEEGELGENSDIQIRKRNDGLILMWKDLSDKMVYAKGLYCNKFIGYGVDGSNTAHLRSQVNPPEGQIYGPGDVCFVSINGGKRNNQFRAEARIKTIEEAISAIEAGALIMTDTESDIRKDTNARYGASFMIDEFKKLGYFYTEKNISVDGHTYTVGIWSKNDITTDTTQEEETLPAMPEEKVVTLKSILKELGLSGKNPNYLTIREIGLIIKEINKQKLPVVNRSPRLAKLVKSINRHQTIEPSIDGLKNKVLRITKVLSEDPIIMDRAMQRMDSGLINNQIAKNENPLIETVNPNSVKSVPYWQRTSTVGKTEVGIMASAIKGLSTMMFYFNSYSLEGVEHSEMDEVMKKFRVEKLTFKIKNKDSSVTVIEKGPITRLAGTNMKMYGNHLQESFDELQKLVENNEDLLNELTTAAYNGDINALKEIMAQHLAFKDNNVADIMSVMLSLAADNAKELALGSLNCTEDTAKIVIALFALGFTPEEAVKISMTCLSEVVSRTIRTDRLKGEAVSKPEEILIDLANMISYATPEESKDGVSIDDIPSLKQDKMILPQGTIVNDIDCSGLSILESQALVNGDLTRYADESDKDFLIRRVKYIVEKSGLTIPEEAKPYFESLQDAMRVLYNTPESNVTPIIIKQVVDAANAFLEVAFGEPLLLAWANANPDVISDLIKKLRAKSSSTLLSNRPQFAKLLSRVVNKMSDSVNYQSLLEVLQVGQQMTETSISLGMNQGIKADIGNLSRKLAKVYAPAYENAMRGEGGRDRKNVYECIVYGLTKLGKLTGNENLGDIEQAVLNGDFEELNIKQFLSDDKFANSDFTYADLILAISEMNKKIVNQIDVVMSVANQRAYFQVAYAVHERLKASGSYRLKNKADMQGFDKIDYSTWQNAYDDQMMHEFLSRLEYSAGRYTFNRTKMMGVAEYQYGVRQKEGLQSKLFDLSTHDGLKTFKDIMENMFSQLRRTMSDNIFLENFTIKSSKDSYARYRIDLTRYEDNGSLDEVKMDMVEAFRQLCLKASPFLNINGEYLSFGELIYLYNRIFGSRGMGMLQSEMADILTAVNPNAINGMSVPQAISKTIADADRGVFFDEEQQLELINKVVVERESKMAEESRGKKYKKHISRDNNQMKIVKLLALEYGSSKRLFSVIYTEKTTNDFNLINIDNDGLDPAKTTELQNAIMAMVMQNIDTNKYEPVIEC